MVVISVIDSVQCVLLMSWLDIQVSEVIYYGICSKCKEDDVYADIAMLCVWYGGRCIT